MTHPDPSSFAYVGEELGLFAQATTWKSYFAARLRPYLGNRVLEVGAGLGGTTRLLCRADHETWTCLEPDPKLLEQLQAELGSGRLPACCEPRVGTTADLPPGSDYDTILYIDVLEHIEDDRGELTRAIGLLKPGGHVVVLSPAHPWLFTPFDASIGHFRRYNRAMLRSLTPEGSIAVRIFYLDSVGMLASLANRLVLSQSMPTAGQIRFWDRVLVRGSRVLDPLLGYHVGKSVVGIWQRRAE